MSCQESLMDTFWIIISSMIWSLHRIQQSYWIYSSNLRIISRCLGKLWRRSSISKAMTVALLLLHSPVVLVMLTWSRSSLGYKIQELSNLISSLLMRVREVFIPVSCRILNLQWNSRLNSSSRSNQSWPRMSSRPFSINLIWMDSHPSQPFWVRQPHRWSRQRSSKHYWVTFLTLQIWRASPHLQDIQDSSSTLWLLVSNWVYSNQWRRSLRCWILGLSLLRTMEWHPLSMHLIKIMLIYSNWYCLRQTLMIS